MKRCFLAAVICLAAPLAGAFSAQAQNANPVSDTLRQVLDDNAKNLVATAQEFPVEKYTFHPTPEGMTVGKTMAHIAQVNNFACAKVGGIAAPAPGKAPGETAKDALVANLKASMDFCKQAFAGLTDAKMGEPVPWFGGHQTSRFDAAIEVTNDLVDHYATLAVYLRLNGLLPPTAQPAAK
jgi:DinB family protein